MVNKTFQRNKLKIQKGRGFLELDTRTDKCQKVFSDFVSHATCFSLAFACVQFHCTGQRSQILFGYGNLTLPISAVFSVTTTTVKNFLHVGFMVKQFRIMTVFLPDLCHRGGVLVK